MPLDERSRLTFHAWLVDHDLDAEVASAILGVMPPFDWHEIPKKHDLDRRFEEVDRRFDQIDRRFDQIDRRFDHIDARFDLLAQSIEVQIDKAMAENLRWTLVTMVVLLTAFAGLILRFG